MTEDIDEAPPKGFVKPVSAFTLVDFKADMEGGEPPSRFETPAAGVDP